MVGTTKRHLTFFEMLGNFSVGDYFKQGAAEYAWELSTQGFGFDPDKVWISVFGGDQDLGVEGRHSGASGLALRVIVRASPANDVKPKVPEAT